MTNSITIDISKYPEGSGRKEVQKDENGYHYTDNSGGQVNLTDEWYPDLEGTYRRFTHSLEGGYKIGNITKGGTPQEGFFENLSQYSSVSVYYWSLDSTCTRPLLIQFGTGDDEYYTNHKGLKDWNKQSKISNNILKSKLDGENCTRNGVHIVNIAEKSNGTYECPSCSTNTRIQVSYNSGRYTDYSTHSISGSKLSVSGFKDGSNWQTGLPSLKGASTIKVEWYKSGGTNPLITVYQSPLRYFRNGKNKNNWIEVSGRQDLPTGETPNLLLDLSNLSGRYPGSTGVIVTLRSSHIGYGYYRYQHSLCGGPFKVAQVKHNKNVLEGITPSPDDTLSSISAYYFGEDPVYENLVLVQLGNTYYTWKSGYNWTSTSGTANLTNLKKEVCRRRGHVLDIAKAGGQSYPCAFGCGQTIHLISTESGNNYTENRHNISSNFSVSYFVENGTNKINLPSAKDISAVYVYWYPPKGDNSKPLLICLPNPSSDEVEETSSNYIWYQRESSDSSNWKPVNNPPSNYNDSPKILSLLKKINGDKEGLSDGAIAGISVPTILTGGGAIAVTAWKWPAIVSFIITHL